MTGFKLSDRVRVLTHIVQAEGEICQIVHKIGEPSRYSISLDNGGYSGSRLESDIELVNAPVRRSGDVR